MDMTEIAERLTAVEGETRALRDWQKRQNGSLQRVADKVEAIDDKLEKGRTELYKWLVGLMGGMVVSLVLLLVQAWK